MEWRDEVADGCVAKPGVTRPAEASKHSAGFFIGGLFLLIALGGLAM